jgi:hypothetical protein
MHGPMYIKFKKVKFTLERAMKTQKGSRGIALLFLNLKTRQGLVFNTSVHKHLKMFHINL